MSAIRSSSNLIRNDYGRGRWADVINYIVELNEIEKEKEDDKLKDIIVIVIPRMPGNIQTSDVYNLRIDLQGTFPDHNQPGVTWHNLQLQENRPRASNESTTVFTTYVHKEGYEHWGNHINSSSILNAMQQQAYHQIPECCVFMLQDGNVITGQMIPRSPHGIANYPIWKPK